MKEDTCTCKLFTNMVIFHKKFNAKKVPKVDRNMQVHNYFKMSFKNAMQNIQGCKQCLQFANYSSTNKSKCIMNTLFAI